MDNSYKRIYQFGENYTSIYINGNLVSEGGRDPYFRLNLVPIDFDNKTVLDLGCNCGGMLFALCDKIKKGFGFEVNQHAIDFANSIRKDFHIENLEFSVKDLEKKDEIEFPESDIVFML
jgi:SAM-dependent methyltransferase